MSEANEAIERIERLIQSPYHASFNVRYEQMDKKIKIENAQIWRPNGSLLSGDQKVEAWIQFPDQKIRTTPLYHDSGASTWKGEYDTRGLVCGSAPIYLQGVDNKNDFVTCSGSVAVISFPKGESCPNCHFTITSGDFVCPNCGKRLSVF